MEKNETLFITNPNLKDINQKLPFDLGYLTKVNKYYWINEEGEILLNQDISFLSEIINGTNENSKKKYFLIRLINREIKSWLFSGISNISLNTINPWIEIIDGNCSLEIIELLNSDFYLISERCQEDNGNIKIMLSDILYILEIENPEQFKANACSWNSPLNCEAILKSYRRPYYY